MKHRKTSRFMEKILLTKSSWNSPILLKLSRQNVIEAFKATNEEVQNLDKVYRKYILLLRGSIPKKINALQMHQIT